MEAQEVCQQVFKTEDCYQQMSILRNCDHEMLVDITMRFIDQLNKAQPDPQQALKDEMYAKTGHRDDPAVGPDAAGGHHRDWQ